MAFFNEFKEMVNKAAQSVSSKTRESVELTRLSGEGRSAVVELNGLYEQIGRTYVETKGANPEALAPLCARAEELKKRIDEIERQKTQLRNQNRCPACGAVSAQNARFCASCGRRLPEPQPETKPDPETEIIVYCNECGAMRGDGEEFCSVCGASFSAPRTEAPRKPEKRSYIVINPADNSDEAPTDFEAD